MQSIIPESLKTLFLTITEKTAQFPVLLSTSGIFKVRNTSEISTMRVQESFLQVSVQNAEFWYNFRF